MPQFHIRFKSNPADIETVKKGLKSAAMEANKTGAAGSQAFKKIESGAKAAGTAAARTGRQMNAAMASSVGTANRLRTALAGLLSVYTAFRVISSATRLVAQFEETMSAVRAVTGATTAEFREMNRVARDLASVTKFTAAEAAGGLRFLGQAGFSAQESIAALPDTLLLAEIGLLDMGRAGDIATNIMAGFGKPVSELNDAVDVLAVTATNANTNIEQLGFAMSYVAPVARSMSISFEETNAAIGQLSNAGIQGTRAGTALRAILLRLNDAGYDLSRGLVPVLRQLNQEGADIDKLTDIVGIRFAGALDVLVQNNAGVQELRERLDDADGAAEKMAETMRDNLKNALDVARSAFAELTLSIFDFIDLEKGVRSFARAINYLSDNLDILADVLHGAAFLAMWRGVVAVFARLQFQITTMLFGILDAGRALRTVIGVFGRLALTLPRMIALLGALKTATLAGTAAWAGLKAAAVGVLAVLRTSLMGALTGLVPILGIITTAVLAFSGVFERSANPHVRKFGHEVEVAKEMMAEFLIQFAQTFSSEPIDSLGEAMAKMGSQMIDMFGGILRFLLMIREAIDDILARMPGGNVGRFSTGAEKIKIGLLETFGGEAGAIEALQEFMKSEQEQMTYTGPGFWGFTRKEVGLERADAARMLSWLEGGGAESVGIGGRRATEEWIDRQFRTGEGSEFRTRVDERSDEFFLQGVFRRERKRTANIQKRLNDEMERTFEGYVTSSSGPDIARRNILPPEMTAERALRLAADIRGVTGYDSAADRVARGGTPVTPAAALRLQGAYAGATTTTPSDIIARGGTLGISDQEAIRRARAISGAVTDTASDRIARGEALGEEEKITEEKEKQALAIDDFNQSLDQQFQLQLMTAATAEQEQAIYSLIADAKSRDQVLTEAQLNQARERLRLLQTQEQIIEGLGASAQTATSVISSTFSQWFEDGKTSWKEFGSELGTQFAEGFVDQLLEGLNRVVDYLGKTLIKVLDETSGGSGGFDWGELASSFFGVSTDTPGAQYGGEFMVGGRSGVDNNTLSLNGVPQLRVSRGERVSVQPAGMRAEQGAQISVNMPVTINESRNPGTTQSQLDRFRRQVVAEVEQKLNNNRRLTGRVA